MFVAFALGAAFFAAAAYAGILAASLLRIESLPDGPRPAQPPVLWIIAVSAIVGGFVTAHASSPGAIILLAGLCAILAAVCCTDMQYGIVPDVFTILPLTALLAYAVAARQWQIPVSAAVPFFPFAIVAAISRGKGIGWGDVKLAALGGAVLGAQTATVAFTLSCFAAVIVAHVRGRRGDPIAFAPYLAGAIAAAMPLGTVV